MSAISNFMQTVTRYKANSGRVFEDEAAATADDLLFAQQQEVSRLLPQAVDDACTYANGGGYVQHSVADVAAFKAGLRKLIAMEFGEHSEALKHFDTNPTGYAGRYLDDSGSNTYRLWSRLAHIDSQLREWGQGYYALHPEEGTQKPWLVVVKAGMKFYS